MTNKIERSIFFRIHTNTLSNWQVIFYLIVRGYTKFQVQRTYLNQNKFWEVTKLVNAKVVRTNVVFTENEEIVISEEVPSINSVETKTLLFQQQYYTKIENNSNLIFLQKASYAFSRKEELFYHGINWVIPKIISLGFFNPENSNPSTLLINHTLHWRVKEFLYQKNSILANNWNIMEVSEKETFIIGELKIISTLQGESSQNSFLQIEHANMLSESHESSLIKHEYLYVKRGKDARLQDSRNLINAAEIENILLSKGFISIDLADYPLSDQIALMRNAKIVVGTHGGNFSLLPFFAHNNPIILEIFCGLISNCFEVQCAQLKIKYFKVNASDTVKGFQLNAEEFRSILNKIIAR
jgi:hypothetical protein